MLTSFLLDSRIPVAELMTARLDGDVRSIGWSFVPADIPSTDELRATVLSLVVADAWVVEGRAAGWVHGVLPAPLRVVAGRSVSVRPAREPTAVHQRQVSYPEGDVVRVGPLLVTPALRTALDLARREAVFDLRLATAVATLLDRAGVDPARARRAVAGREGMPYRLLVLDRLAQVERLARTGPVSRP